MRINFGPHWIFISDCAYLFILILSSTDMPNRDKGLPNIISAGCQGKCRSSHFLIKSPKNLNQNPPNNINYIFGQLNWPPYKQINVCLLNDQSAISLQNVFSLYFGFKTCPAGSHGATGSL